MTTAPATIAPATVVRIEFAKRHPLDEPRVALILVPTALVADLTAAEVAEQVFVATNAPYEVDGLAGAIRGRFAARAERGVFYPALSVGDYVRTGKGQTVKVEPVGFSTVTSV